MVSLMARRDEPPGDPLSTMLGRPLALLRRIGKIGGMPRLRTKLIAFLGLFLAPLPTADAFGPTPNPVQHSAESRLMAEFARFATLTDGTRSEEHTSELQSLMRISYAALCL